MLMAQHQQLYQLQKKVGLIKGKKTQENSRAFEERVAALEVKADNISNEHLFADIEKTKSNNRNNPALDRKGSRIRQTHCAERQLCKSS